MNVGLYTYLARRWVLFAILPALVIGFFYYFYVAHQPKQYETSVSLYVQQPSQQSGVPGSTDIYTSQAIIPTYIQMIQSPVIAQTVNQDMATRYPGFNLGGHSLKVSGASGVAASSGGQSTTLIQMTVDDTNRKRAADAANSVAHAFIKEIRAVQRARFQGGETTIKRQVALAQSNIQTVTQRIANWHGTQGDLNNLRAELGAYQSIYESLLASSQQFIVNRDTALNAVKIFSPATVPVNPIGPHPTRSALLAAFIALVICVGAILLYDYFDDTPRTPEEVEELMGAPILGTVQQFDPGKTGTQLVSARNARSPLAEAYRIIRTNLQYINIDEPPRTILVTSSSPSEGKSTTASNLANVFAEAGRRVLLVDADLRRPSLHRIFQHDRSEGLTNMLISGEELNGHGAQETGYPNLALVASGPVPPRPADLLGSHRMQDLIAHMRGRSDLVVIDSPPLLAVTDAAILSTITDGVILVVDTSKSKRRDLKRSREAIEAVGGKILGVVINKLTKQGSTYYYYYYQHNYGYAYQYNYSSTPERTDTGDKVEAGR